MKKIGDLLGKFTSIVVKSVSTREAVIAAFENAGIKVIDQNNMTINGNVVRLKASAIVKNEIFLKQQKILAELAKNPLTKNITKIL